jgi:hypothetical protein
MRLLVPVVCVSLFALSLSAADQPDEPKTLMTQRGKQLLSDDLTKPFAGQWKVAKGKWDVTDGSIRGSELKSDMHGAVARHPVGFENAVIEYSFKLDGSPRMTTLSINAAKGHVCRVAVRPNGFTVQKDDQDGKNGPDKPAVLQTVETAVKAGEWHTLVIELFGKEMLATLDGQHTAYGVHEKIQGPKANVGLTVAGESVSFKNLRVWEAVPNKSWAENKAKLLAGRKGK